jgi:glutamate synthase domain-containing protein 2
MRYPFYITTGLILIFETICFFFWPVGLWTLILFLPLVVIGFMDIYSKHTIKRNFPIIGNFRFILESVRPEIMQYFVETDTEGRPLNRIFRSLIYQRAKKVNDTTPFGTQQDVYRAGYEWMSHSMFPIPFEKMEKEPRVIIGGPDCKLPYSASLLNISAMSYGALSKHAILALNGGAQIGNFYHNTGEGGISPYHLKPGGDLVWQIGTGYFGCRDLEGNFSIEKFKERAAHDAVKMIEIKLSQGAKPGHGGILPASKNNAEIAEIRGVKPHTTVFSPPCHTAFNSADELLHFISELREASGGKPVGFKLCVGRRDEFIAICESMKKSGILPDFITVDGGEGGTGAAPVEFSNSLGMPLRDGLSFVHETLVNYGLRKNLKIIASGKILTGFHMVRAFALGADLCNTARAMMLALGCIQALKCNTNTCPTGVATQDRMLMRGLIPEDKAVRVANFHEETIKALTELLAAAGLHETSEIKRSHIHRRTSMNQVNTYEELYPLSAVPDSELKEEPFARV